MGIVNPRTHEILAGILAGRPAEEKARDLAPRVPGRDELPPSVPGRDEYTTESMHERRAMLRSLGFNIDQRAGEGEEISAEDLRANVKSLVGFARVPVGVIGPLRVNGLHVSRSRSSDTGRSQWWEASRADPSGCRDTMRMRSPLSFPRPVGMSPASRRLPWA